MNCRVKIAAFFFQMMGSSFRLWFPFAALKWLSSFFPLTFNLAQDFILDSFLACTVEMDEHGVNRRANPFLKSAASVPLRVFPAY